MTTATCAACGGPLTPAVESCHERPGLLSLVDIYDALVLDNVSVLDVDLPSRCPGCGVAVAEPHHVGCTLARCSLHRCARDQDQCDCDARYLEAVARADRPRWRTTARYPGRGGRNGDGAHSAAARRSSEASATPNRRSKEKTMTEISNREDMLAALKDRGMVTPKVLARLANRPRRPGSPPSHYYRQQLEQELERRRRNPLLSTESYLPGGPRQVLLTEPQDSDPLIELANAAYIEELRQMFEHDIAWIRQRRIVEPVLARARAAEERHRQQQLLRLKTAVRDRR